MVIAFSTLYYFDLLKKNVFFFLLANFRLLQVLLLHMALDLQISYSRNNTTKIFKLGIGIFQG